MNYGFGYKKSSESGGGGEPLTSCYYRLDKSNSEYLDFGNSFGSVITGNPNAWTIIIEFERRSVSNASQDTLFSVWNGSTNNREIAVRIMTNNRLEFLSSNDGLATDYRSETTTDLTTSFTKNMIAVRFDGSQTVSANVMDFWHNGSVMAKTVPTDTESGSVHNIYNGSASAFIGALTGGGGLAQFANIRLDSFSIYNDWLNDTRLTTIYNSGDLIDQTSESNITNYYKVIGDSWNGSEFDVSDSVGAVDGVSINMASDDLICS